MVTAPSQNKPKLICAVTLDTEPDCDIHWRLTNPLAFRSVTKLIPELYRPLWQRFSVRPTYFVSPNVLRDEEPIKALRDELEQGAEIGAHLHPEYIEPNRKYIDPAGTVSDEFPCTAYPYEIELEKIRNLTALIERKIGQRPTSYRAGRFGADNDTMRALRATGYTVDSSITPGINWIKKGGPDHSAAPHQPYYITDENYYRASETQNNVLEVPITIAGKRLGPLGRFLPDNWLAYNWLRPSHMTLWEQKRLIQNVLNTNREQPVIVFTMMFHSMEPLVESTPFVRTKLERALYIGRLTKTISYLHDLSCQFMTMAEIGRYFREHQVIPRPTGRLINKTYRDHTRYLQISPEQYNKRFLPTYLLWRKPADRVLMPLVRSITGKKILDIGCGTGCYTNYLTAQHNQVLGVDKNIHLAAGQSFRVVEGGADDFQTKVTGKYELVFSTWLTDYLSPDEMRAFMKNAQAVLTPGGELIFTAISPRGWGGLYIWMARHLRHVRKFNYQPEIIHRWLDREHFCDVQIIPMRSWLRIPWTYIVRAKKPAGPGESAPIKVGLMARGLTRGGVSRFINNVLNEFDRMADPRFNFVLFIDDPTYQQRYRNIKVVYRKRINKIYWEYFQILPDLRREKCDYMIYPKNTTPLTHHYFHFKKMVIIHDLAYLKEPYLEYKFLDTLYLKASTPISCQRADNILAVSDATAQAIVRKLGISPEKIHTIYEAVEDCFSKTLPKERREKIIMKYGLQRPFLFYCGALSPRKNGLRVLQAFNQIKDRIPHNFYLTVGTSWHDKNVRQYIKEYLTDRVFLLGYITEEELMALYQEASAFLYPSLLEGFGLPILEAQASGCPVLTSNISSCAETAGRGAHLVNPYSIDEISDGIMKIVTDTAYRDQLVALGRTNIERYSWKRVARSILEPIIRHA